LLLSCKKTLVLTAEKKRTCRGEQEKTPPFSAEKIKGEEKKKRNAVPREEKERIAGNMKGGRKEWPCTFFRPKKKRGRLCHGVSWGKKGGSDTRLTWGRKE